MPAVGHPLAHISCKSADIPRIGREVSSGRRPPVAVAVVVEGVVPLAAGRRAVAPAGEVARVARRRALAPRVGRTAAGRSEEHTSELQSLMRNSYAVFCLKTKQKIYLINT